MTAQTPFPRRASSDPAAGETPLPSAQHPNATRAQAGEDLDLFGTAGGQPLGSVPEKAPGGGAACSTRPILRLPPLAYFRADLRPTGPVESPLVPPAPVPPLVDAAAGQGGHPIGPTLAALLALRADQAERHGHTAAADDLQDLYDLAKAADRPFARMRESASVRHLEATRIHALKSAAIALAIAESCDRRLAALDDVSPEGPKA